MSSDEGFLFSSQKITLIFFFVSSHKRATVSDTDVDSVSYTHLLCPFGWFQDLLHKIPGKKFSTARLKPLRYLKYMILIVFVILLPLFVTNSIGMGDPFFCKYTVSYTHLDVYKRQIIVLFHVISRNPFLSFQAFVTNNDCEFSVTRKFKSNIATRV